MQYQEIGRMTFKQFEEFIRLHGGRSWKYKQTIGDSRIDFMGMVRLLRDRSIPGPRPALADVLGLEQRDAGKIRNRSRRKPRSAHS